jgi:hypothetical protein
VQSSRFVGGTETRRADWKCCLAHRALSPAPSLQGIEEQNSLSLPMLQNNELTRNRLSIYLSCHQRHKIRPSALYEKLHGLVYTMMSRKMAMDSTDRGVQTQALLSLFCYTVISIALSSSYRLFPAHRYTQGFNSRGRRDVCFEIDFA